VRQEIEGLLEVYASTSEAKRRTQMLTVVDEPEYTADDFIVAEDCAILITTDGWVKRQKQITDPSKSRLREGDRVLACVAGSTRSVVGFFSSLGVCYSARMVDVPPSTGYGEPIQKLFKLKDGEKIIACVSFDERVIGDIAENPKKPDLCPPVHGLAATTNGYAMRFGLATFAEPSTRGGRRYCRVATGSEVVNVFAVSGTETILAITANCRAMICPAEEINYLGGAGKGVVLIKVAKGDALLGFKPSTGDRDLLVVVTNRGAKKTISTAKYRVTSRGGRGNEIQKNGKIAHVVLPEPGAPPVLEDDEE
jgi:DNA gyrase subunit A